MPKFTVTFSQLRWEHTEVVVEAESPEAASKIGKEMIESGEVNDKDWDLGDTEGDIEVDVDEKPAR